MTDDTLGPQKATRVLPPDPNFEVRQMKSWRGHDGSYSTIHGLYRKELTAEEMEVAEYLVADWRAKYDLDDGVDLAMLWKAVASYLKSVRNSPGEKDDHNQADFKAQQARLFRDYADGLGITRKQRKGEGAGDAAIAALQSIVKATDEKDEPTEEEGASA